MTPYWGGVGPWKEWARAYRVYFRGAEFRVRLYSLEEYLDVLGGSMETLVEAAEERGTTGRFPYVGALAVDFPQDYPDEAAEMTSYEIAEEIVGFGCDDFYPVPPNDEEWGVGEDDAYLVVRWPADAPRILIEEID